METDLYADDGVFGSDNSISERYHRLVNTISPLDVLAIRCRYHVGLPDQ